MRERWIVFEVVEREQVVEPVPEQQPVRVPPQEPVV